ncbi:ABC transporter substrate-binding protein [Alteribacillus sp. JSM 102045]|uniref:ABC transporter substrate-binding protein n=1 Tax=Alteribacillus sp. JSM 102045 TaxID=1562101 RepID=UPI0035C02ABC
MFKTIDHGKVSYLLSVLLVVTLFLVVCGNNETSSSDTNNSESGVSEEEPIKFGFISSLSGGNASSGEPMKQGAELAIKHINEDGGIMGRQVELEVRDDKGSPEEAVKVVRDLQNNGVHFFLGVISSNVALSLSPAMEELDSILITAAAHSDRLTGEDFNEHYFRVTDNAQMRNYAGAKIIAERYPDITEWATFSPDYEYGKNTHDRFFEALQEYNADVELIHESWPAFGASDFKNYITAVQNADPQGVFSSLYAGDAIVMSQQAASYNFYEGIDVFVNPSAERDIREQLGQNMHEEWGGLHYYAPAFDNDINNRFVEDYKAEHGKEPIGFASEAYNAMLAYKAAIEEAESTETQDVISKLEGIEFDSLTGTTTIREEDHQAIKDVIWIHIVPAKGKTGWEVEETVIIPGDEVILPPSNH